MSKLRGFAPIVIIVIVAVLAVGGFLLYKSGKISIPGVAQMGLRVTEKDFANISDPILRKHFVAQTNVNAVRTVSQSSGKGTKDTTEYQLKGDKFFYRMMEEDGSKETSHMIMIGDTTYLKDYADNKWWKQTSKPEEVPEGQEPPKPEDLKDELVQEDPALYKSLGTEACGDLNCYKYEQTFKDSPGTRTFWFDDKKFLLRKETSGYGEFTNTIEYAYDGINISAPSPTKDVPEGRNIYEYLFSGGGYTPPTDTNVPTDYPVPTDSETPVDYGEDTGY